MLKIFNNASEIEEYFNKETDTYDFIENGIRLDVEFRFSLNINARNINAGNINAGNINAWDINAGNINAGDINARDINAWNINTGDINGRNINAWDINAGDINARDISYYAVCFAYVKIMCVSIKGRRTKSKHFVLDGGIEFIKPKHIITIDGKEIELSEESFNNLKESLGC